MFAYLVIGLEIAILYTVFWYVFLREVKPYRVVGNPWGQYPGDESKPNYEVIDVTEADSSEYCANRARVQFRRGVVSRTQDLPKISRNPAVSYGWDHDDVEKSEHNSLKAMRNLISHIKEIKLS